MENFEIRIELIQGAVKADIVGNKSALQNAISSFLADTKQYNTAIVSAIGYSLMQPGEAMLAHLKNSKVFFSLVSEDDGMKASIKGSEQNVGLLLCRAFVLEPEIRNLFVEAIENLKQGICTCENCVKERESKLLSEQHSINKVVDEFKKGG